MESSNIYSEFFDRIHNMGMKEVDLSTNMEWFNRITGFALLLYEHGMT